MFWNILILFFSVFSLLLPWMRVNKSLDRKKYRWLLWQLHSITLKRTFQVINLFFSLFFYYPFDCEQELDFIFIFFFFSIGKISERERKWETISIGFKAFQLGFYELHQGVGYILLMYLIAIGVQFLSRPAMEELNRI